MAKRFTDTDKWRRPWFRSLPEKYKILWFYILDNCEISGIWYVDFELASFMIGSQFNKDESLATLGKQVDVIEDGSRWFVKDFIGFQYGQLTPTNNLHRSVLASLLKAGIPAPDQGQNSPSRGAKVKVKVKVKVKDKEVSFGKSENLFFGDVPVDLIDLAGRIEPTHDASSWHDLVESEIKCLGYETRREVPCIIDSGRDGRIDLVAYKNGVAVAIELDYRTPRAKSIAKVKTHESGMVLLRDPKIVEITRRNLIPPAIEDVRSYCLERGKGIDPERWFNHYQSNGWKVGNVDMRDWRAAVRTWERSGFNQAQRMAGAATPRPESKKYDHLNIRGNAEPKADTGGANQNGT